MTYYRRRRYIGKRKFDNLAREDRDYIQTFIPRRMDLIPDAVRFKSRWFYTQEMVLTQNFFPHPIWRTINMEQLTRRYYARTRMGDGSVESAAAAGTMPALLDVQQEHPNSHWSLEAPLGVEGEAMSYFASRYKLAMNNGSKATLAVSVRTNLQAVVSTSSGTERLGIPIDCWFGSPASVNELVALNSRWAPIIPYLNEQTVSASSSDMAAPIHWQNSALNATNYWGSSSPVAVGAACTQTTAPWAYNALTRPDEAARPNLRWLFQQTAEEAPRNYKHVCLYAVGPQDINRGLPHSADFSAVYNPVAYYGQAIKSEIAQLSLANQFDPRTFLDMLRLYKVSTSNQTTYTHHEHNVTTGATTSSSPTITSPPINQNFTATTNNLAAYTPNSNSDFATYTVGGVAKHLWVVLVPRVMAGNPDWSWTWPGQPFAENDMDAASGALYGGLRFVFGMKCTHYVTFTDKRDTQEIHDVIPA